VKRLPVCLIMLFNIGTSSKAFSSIGS